jgi:hypothetical protein
MMIHAALRAAAKRDAMRRLFILCGLVILFAAAAPRPARACPS